MRHTPGVTANAGNVAYLLSAGAAADAVGLRVWELPPAVVAEAVREHPRTDFKSVFAQAFRQGAARVPAGRAGCVPDVRTARNQHDDSTPAAPTPAKPTNEASPGRHIGLVLFNDVEELDAVGPWEVLANWTLRF